MGKTQERLEELDAALTALAHESRRHILLVVWFRGGAMSAGEIAARFSCTWPTTSRHLRVLQAAGLLELEKQGRTRVYRVNQQKLEVVQEWLQWFNPASDHDLDVEGRKPRLPTVIRVVPKKVKR